MRIKKLLSIMMVLSLLAGFVPGVAATQSDMIPIKSPRVESVLTKAVTDTPTLSEGNHPSYMDRVASLPDYVLEYYRWMEENSGADGILADPYKGTEDSGEYYHSVTFVSGSEQFTFTDKTTVMTTCSEIAGAALDREFTAFSNWAAVAQDIFDREHPEVFWLSGRSSISYMGGWSYSIRGNTCTVMYNADMVVWLNYPGFDIRAEGYRNLDTLTAAIHTRDAKVQEILADCPDGAVHEKVAYLNDVLTTRNAYNSAVAEGNISAAESNAWECISALEGQSGTAGPVCEGYARAFQILCKELEIPCVLVDGVAVSYPGDAPEEHMWNYVCIDDGWYAVDVTWNDPYLPNKPEEKNTGKENHTWLLLGSDSEVAPGLTFLDSHVVRNRVRANGLSFTNGPVLESAAYSPDVTPLFSISGQLTTATAGDTTVTLLQDGNVVTTLTIADKTAAYSFDQLPAGTYQLQLTKKNYVPREYTVTVGDEPVVLDLKIHLIGDIDGNGRVNVGDVAKLKSHIMNYNKLTDEYQLLVANVNGGRLNMGDTAALYAHIKASKKLY